MYRRQTVAVHSDSYVKFVSHSLSTMQRQGLLYILLHMLATAVETVYGLTVHSNTTISLHILFFEFFFLSGQKGYYIPDQH